MILRRVNLKYAFFLVILIVLGVNACRKDDDSSNDNFNPNGYMPEVYFDRIEPFGNAIYENGKLVKIDNEDENQGDILFNYNEDGLVESYTIYYEDIDTIVLGNDITINEFVYTQDYGMSYYAGTHLLESCWLELVKQTSKENGIIVAEYSEYHGQNDITEVKLFEYDEFGNLIKFGTHPDVLQPFSYNLIETDTTFVYQVENSEEISDKYTFSQPTNINNPYLELFKQTGFFFTDLLWFNCQPKMYGKLSYFYSNGTEDIDLFEFESNSNNWLTKMKIYYTDSDTLSLHFSYQ